VLTSECTHTFFLQNTVPAKPPTVAMQFITRPAAIGIALNAWFMLAFVHTLCQYEDLRKTIPFVPRLLTEQGAEKVFRAMRAVLGSENFTLSDFFRRFDRVTALSILRAVHEGVDMRFPDHECAFRWDETQPADAKAGLLPASVTMDAVNAAIGRAKASLVADALKVGIDVANLPYIVHLDRAGDLADLDDHDDGELAATDLTVAVPSDADFARVTTDLLCGAELRSVRSMRTLGTHSVLIEKRAACPTPLPAVPAVAPPLLCAALSPRADRGGVHQVYTADARRLRVHSGEGARVRCLSGHARTAACAWN
jgi:hypothetical protein